MHYFITGHTGFKGSWLSLLLRARGHEVSGFSLEADPGSLFEVAHLEHLFLRHEIGDIRDRKLLHSSILSAAPDVVMHLAAQPLVRRSYEDPSYTYEVNVNGTLHVLESALAVESIKALLVVTTDKVYKNINSTRGYKETDPLGGVDPYSNSKAMADLLTQSWMETNPEKNIGIARAGNVIGGGDVCKDRLIPDLVRAFKKRETPKLRYPNAVRPWQHVLDCLNGYLILTEHLLIGEGRGAWNFGPTEKDFHTVSDVADLVSRNWGSKVGWSKDEGSHPHESSLLMLDPNKANSELKWQDRYHFREAVEVTTRWYRDVANGADALSRTKFDIETFERASKPLYP